MSEHESDKRPDISQIIQNSMSLILIMYLPYFIIKKKEKKLEIEDSNLSNCEKDCDLDVIVIV
jgi:hypothetical protein